MHEGITPPSSRAEPDLSDFTTCGEDHLYNLSRASRIAPSRCTDCLDYHLTISASRLTGRSSWNRGARPPLVGFVREFLTARAAAASGRIDVVVAGAADTSTLATCAHAAVMAGADIFHRVRFTVLDKCGTPLELCKDFAARHGLNLETEAVDFTRPMPVYPADLIVLHAILVYLPPASHVEFLRQCGRWLKPGGRAFLWNSLVLENSPKDWKHRAGVGAEMRAIVEREVASGRLSLHEPLESYCKRFDRMTDMPRVGAARFSSELALGALLAEAGLPVFSFDRHGGEANSGGLVRPHAAFVFGPPDRENP